MISFVRILAFLGCLAAVGCGSGKTPVVELTGGMITGSVLDSGRPIKRLKEETIQVSFISVDGDGKYSGSGEIKEDGTFSISGNAGKGLPSGKWKITISSEIYGSTGDDRFKDKFDRASTPFTVELSGSGTDNFLVDIGTKKVVKK